jgi:hypothetical protein
MTAAGYLSDDIVSFYKVDFFHVLSKERQDVNWQALYEHEK